MEELGRQKILKERKNSKIPYVTRLLGFKAVREKLSALSSFSF